jgi:hypothetical protein
MLRNLIRTAPGVDAAQRRFRDDQHSSDDSTAQPFSHLNNVASVQVTSPLRGAEHVDAERYEVPGFAWVCGE